MPSLLRYIGIANIPIRSVLSVIERGFQSVCVAWIDANVWTIMLSEEDGVGGRRAAYRTAKYNMAEWLDR